jgi:hypothetical protein
LFSKPVWQRPSSERCINQLERIDAGAIWLDRELTGYRIVCDALHPLNESEIARQRRITGMGSSASTCFLT